MLPYLKEALPADLLALHEDWRVILAAFAATGGAVLGILGIGQQFAVIPIGIIGLVVWLQTRSERPDIEWSAILLTLCFGTGAFLSATQHLQQLPSAEITSDTFIELEGEVVTVEDRVERPLRLTIRLNKTSAENWLLGQQVRLNVRTDAPGGLAPGCVVTTEAVLTPATGPIVPGGYDFGHHAYLSGIVAQGFAASDILERRDSCTNSRPFETARLTIRDHIRSIMPQETSGVAVALLTGDRSGIDVETRTILRDAGLSHLLAISGLHMGLITGAAFFALELLFAGVTSINQRIPARKLAALGAACAATAYLLISGASVATTRAFIMVCIGLLALLTDRRVISLRSLAIAAIALVFLSPEIVVSISFHMSFAATAALILVYEKIAVSKAHKREHGQRKPKIVQYFIGVMGSSLIAQVAIAPLALYHFQSISVLGASANLLAIPIMAFIVMPAALLGTLMIPLGADAVFFWMMELGLGCIIDIADMTSQFPMSSISAPPLHNMFLAALFVAFAIVCIFRHILWLPFSGGLVLVLVLFMHQQPAHILLAGTRPTIGYIGAGEQFFYSGSARSQFRSDAWQQYWGIEANASLSRPARTCSEGTCITQISLQTGQNKTLVSTDNISHLRTACSRNYLVVSSYRYRRFCSKKATFISREDISRFGPLGIWYEFDQDKPIFRWSKTNPFE